EHHELALFQMATDEAPKDSQSGMHHMAWRLGSFAELQAAYRELNAMGFKVERTVEHNVTRSVYFPDPDGNRVELYCDMTANGFETMQPVGTRGDQTAIETGPVVGQDTAVTGACAGT